MREKRASVGLAREGDRRKNVYTALDLVRADIEPKIAESVMLKPNLFASNEQITSTHADAIRGAIDFLLTVERPPDEIIIAEGGNENYSGEAYDNYGYRQLEEEYDLPIRLVDLNGEERWEETAIVVEDRSEFRVRMPKSVLECPCTISVAVAKTHDVGIVTLALKNMIMGSLHRDDRIRIHGYRSHAERVLPEEARLLGINLIRLARFLAPDIGVVDGTVGLQGNGPGGSDGVDLGAAAAGADVYAVDAVMARAMGFEPLKLGFLHYANMLGMGVADLERIEVMGTNLEEVITTFKPHETTAKQLQWQMPDAKEFLPRI